MNNKQIFWVAILGLAASVWYFSQNDGGNDVAPVPDCPGPVCPVPPKVDPVKPRPWGPRETLQLEVSDNKGGPSSIVEIKLPESFGKTFTRIFDLLSKAEKVAWWGIFLSGVVTGVIGLLAGKFLMEGKK